MFLEQGAFQGLAERNSMRMTVRWIWRRCCPVPPLKPTSSGTKAEDCIGPAKTAGLMQAHVVDESAEVSAINRAVYASGNILGGEPERISVCHGRRVIPPTCIPGAAELRISREVVVGAAPAATTLTVSPKNGVR